MSNINYTDVSKVSKALAMQAPETLSAAGNIGDTTITLNQIPQDWYVGSSLLIDGLGSNAEQVTIEGINGTTLTITPLANNHPQNAPIINVTILADYVAYASRWFDNITNNDAGFGYEQVTDEKEAYINNKGYIVAPLNKPTVKLSDITSASFQITPMDTIDTLNLSYARIRDDYFLEVVAPRNYYDRSGIATVTYLGGYNPLPDDITWVATVMAARMYKERDSGYSDIIGSSDTGMFTYKKAMPADVKAIVQNYKRWTE